MRVIVAGGGTGGHAFPALAISEELRDRDPQLELWYVGKRGNIEERLAKQAGIPFRPIHVGALARRGGLRNVGSVVKTGFGFLESLLLLLRFRPQVVVGTGGYVSVPPVAAAALLRVPTLIHEQNSVPGRANRLLARWAKAVAATFVDSVSAFNSAQVHVTGNPIRSSLRPEALSRIDRGEARRRFGLDPDVPTVLVFGGSQGARALTTAVLDALHALEGRAAQVLLVTGRSEADAARTRAAAAPIRCEVREFIEDMAHAYVAADLVICRSGASTLAEVTAAGLPAILVPYPYAIDDHQRMNAEALAGTGAAEIVAEADLAQGALVKRLIALLDDPAARRAMAAASREAAIPGAAERIANLVCDLAIPGRTDA